MPTNPYTRPITSTATPEAAETADYRVTVTRPTPDGPTVETHTHRGVNSLNWDDRYLRLHPHTDTGALPVAMYAHAAVLDVQAIGEEQDELDALLLTHLTPSELRRVAERMEREGWTTLDPLGVVRFAEQATPLGDGAAMTWAATVKFCDGTRAEHVAVQLVAVNNDSGDVVLYDRNGKIIEEYIASTVDTVEHIDGKGEATTYAPRFTGADASDPGRYTMRQVAP